MWLSRVTQELSLSKPPHGPRIDPVHATKADASFGFLSLVDSIGFLERGKKHPVCYAGSLQSLFPCNSIGTISGVVRQRLSLQCVIVATWRLILSGSPHLALRFCLSSSRRFGVGLVEDAGSGLVFQIGNGIGSMGGPCSAFVLLRGRISGNTSVKSDMVIVGEN
jgi:hypothetical protein